MYTDAQTMAWIMDTYSMMAGNAAPGVVTGKPVSLGGSEGRADATARGLHVRHRGSLQGQAHVAARRDVAIQGYGNVGATAARLFAEKKAKIVAISDSRGGVHNPRASIR